MADAVIIAIVLKLTSALLATLCQTQWEES